MVFVEPPRLAMDRGRSVSEHAVEGARNGGGPGAMRARL